MKQMESNGPILGEDGLITELGRQIAVAEEKGNCVSIVAVDIDEFGKVNQKFGRDIADAALDFTNEFLKSIALESGAEVHRAKFRQGGDETVIILHGVEKEDAFLLAERKRVEYAGKHEFTSGGRSERVALTFSAAVATYPEDGNRAQDVLRKAMDAIYRAKMTGRNKVCLAKEEKMVTKTSHYTQPQLARLSHLSKREKVGEAVLLREALDNLLRMYGA